VEVEDGAAHLPTRRNFPDTAGTGRGLRLIEEVTDRWGVIARDPGKTVWFEIGEASPRTDGGETSAASVPLTHADEGSASVTLRQMPLLMHVAWQEHAATLLRELLLHSIEEEGTFDHHAQASDALAVLAEQVPVPHLSDEPDALMDEAVEPDVTAEELVLQIPIGSVAHFHTLDVLLARAIREARAGRFLSPPTQPEIDEMRQWLCREVARQAAGDTTATPWVARADVRATLADQAQLTARYEELAKDDEALLATDEASIIVAASRGALEILGYSRADQLLGRRVIVVVPARFHQAHIAGTTLHATNGRDTLLNLPITVPMVRADGTEVTVELEVRPQRVDDERRVFVARLRPT
jgi:PAS domain S-box-containing protein